MKNAFLFDVAFDLYEKFGKNNELNKITILMPSNRGKIFADKYFTKLSSGKQIQLPKYTNTINLLAEVSGRQNAGNDQIRKITLIWELWNVYKEKIKSSENFDEFFPFGEILLNDFDEIDKEMKNAEGIFRNVAELGAINKPDYLTDDEIKSVRRFFNFDYEKSTDLQKKFRGIWNKLYEVYTEFNVNLEEKKLAYDGMFMRKTIQNLQDFSDGFTQKKYVFAGYNKFSKTEIKLIEYLKAQEKTLFYWDFDEYYKDIITEYREKFGDELNKIPDNFGKEKNISFIQSSGNTLQAGYIPKWLKSIADKDFNDADCAIILCDEGLLPAVLSALPKEIEPNIAILYPLRQTLIASLFVKLLDETIFAANIDDSQKLLKYLQSEIIKIKDKNAIENNIEIAAFREITEMLTNTEKISEKINEPQIFTKIIKKLLFSMRIPYYGEPAKGIQIMAMSDTRNMDFENILMFSVNETIIPKIETENSFIPQFLRKYFELNTIEEQNRREYYNFYRLLQRAKNISLSYCTGKTGIGKGEMSRYLLQIFCLSPHKEKIKKIVIGANVQNEINKKEIKIEKTAEILNKLKEKYTQKFLSPSAFNNYIDCSLQFYFKYVAKIRKPDNDSELNFAVLGKIFHKTMELIYKNSEGKGEIPANFFDNLNYENLIKKAFESEFLGNQTVKSEYSGEQLIFFKVISQMVKNMLDYDKKHTPFEILGLEQEHFFERNGIKIGGIIDRIDKVNGKIRVVDYKTGKIPNENDFAKEISVVFSPNRPKKAGYQLQTYLYSSILSESENYKGFEVSPNLIFVLQSEIEKEKINGFHEIFPEIKEKFDKNLVEKLQELFNPEIPFKQSEKSDKCKYCDYCGICGREIINI